MSPISNPSTKETTVRGDPRRPLAPAFLLILAWAPVPGAAASPPTDTEATEAARPALRAAPPPTELERARVERWDRRWRDEAGDLERSFAAASRAVEAGDYRRLESGCAPLARALIELDRPQILPVPDRAADLHVRRALRHLARAALTCLTRRPYAARHALEQAADAFAEARRVLRRYRRPARKPASPPSRP